MAEDEIIDVNELVPEDSEPGTQYLGLGVPSGSSSQRSMTIVRLATTQASCFDCSRARLIFTDTCPDCLG